MNTVKVIILVEDANGQVLQSFADTKQVSTTVTGVDLEYELVYNGNGNPIVRPINAPKY